MFYMRVCLFATGIVLVLYLVFYQSVPSKKEIPFRYIKRNSKESKNVKTVLEWTGIYSSGVDGYWRWGSKFCPELIPLCNFTNDKNLVDEADAISFSIRQSGWTVAKVPERRYLHQRYVMYMGESAAHTYFDLKTVENFFNWTMTTRMDSDIWWPYGQFVPKDQPSPEPFPNYGDIGELVRNKTKLVAWYVSNCETHGKREKYVKELQKYIPVDIYGACGPLKCDTQKGNCEENLARNYYFYLAFENSVCDDYVTEKYYWKIRHYVVPVVLRAKDYKKLDPEGYPVAPEGSFIAVDNFTNPKELANFLKNVAANEQLYMSYFDWHNKWKVNRYFGRNIALCQLCRMLHLNLPAKTWGKELVSWWYGTKNHLNCEPNFAIKGQENW